MTRIAAFIRENTEQILTEWDAFARGLPQGKSMDVDALRDHAREMLDVIARELTTPRTTQKLAEDAEGRTKSDDDGRTPAQGHGAGRALSGFTIAEMVAEFRALRVSVTSLWISQQHELDAIDFLDMSRFNEAIDQAIAESTTRYTDELERTKDRFIAILGHDLRSPLNAIVMSASFLLEEKDLGKASGGLVTRIAASAKTINNLVTDLLDFARIRFGGGIPLELEPVDLHAVINEVVAEVTASHRGSDVRVDMEADLRGEWDSSRLAQAFTNLITNAVEHGSSQSSVTVTAHGTATEVVISVHNHGLVIPEIEMGRLFDIMSPTTNDEVRSAHHLGLGLNIVHSIVVAHGGSIDVKSSANEGTTFTVRLPRSPQRGSRRKRREGARPDVRDRERPHTAGDR